MKHRPPLSFSVITKIFLLASFGTTIHLNVYYAGLAYTSPTVASALSNVVPCLTFLIAVILRMETVKITSTRGQAKVLGTLVCIGGALTFTFWKGRYLLKGFVHRPLINICSTNISVCGLSHGKDNWIKGSALILISHVAWSAWLILQAVVSKVYPARLSLNVLICFFASLQSSFLALFFARNPTLWKLEWNMQLLTIIYSGVVISALVYYLQTWCISNKGPVFAAMFSPLLLIIVGIFSAIFFAERLRLGSLAGAFLIILGLYIVLWAKYADNVVTRVTENGKGLNDNKMLEISINETLRNSVTNETK
ncbi:WAT1-related protein At5g64700-like isoform X2 [Juglans microcarpa x Juglans regia]|uniref:WAT1-related protein At5g64700-like isoform X2 n=1 Tax=Juglans microcarpa x Juglans regia TaxID=2249226 RepID=UPI001B7E29EF|nr:WAT1-related protein At5g64700-like isoform X2 [Juglans microcarpa x Juglans regia]